MIGTFNMLSKIFCTVMLLSALAYLGIFFFGQWIHDSREAILESQGVYGLVVLALGMQFTLGIFLAWLVTKEIYGIWKKKMTESDG